ncbi:MAG: PAS domain S-box protein [Anaerolineales bacterium]|nr:PAS domain S-box protein [Anaerolineales bacterium]
MKTVLARSRFKFSRPAAWTWRGWAAAAAAYLALYGLWLAARPPGEALHQAVGHLAQLLPAWLASRAALARAADQGLPPPLRRSWSFLGLAVAVWAAGGLIWTGYRVFQGLRPPLPSLADPVYMAGHLLALAAVFGLSTAPRGRLGSFRAFLDLGILTGVGLVLGWLLLIQPVLAGVGLRPAETLWTAVYPLLDILLLVLLTNLVVVLEPAGLRPALGLAAAGLVLFVIADLAYTYLGLRGQVDNDAVFDLGRLAGAALLGLGAVWPAQSASPDEMAGRWPRWMARLQAMLPLAAGIVLAWYTVLDWRATGQLDPVAAGMTALLALAVVARQGVIAGEFELRQYAQLVEGAADPAFICDAQGRLRLANPALAAALGQPAGTRLVGQSVLAYITADSFPPDLRIRGRSLSPQALEEGWSGEVRLRRSDGSDFPVYLALRPVPDDSGAPPVLAGTAHDLSVQKRQQAALVAALEAAAAARRTVEVLNQGLEAKVAEKTRSLSEAYGQLESQNEALKTLDQLKSEFVSLVSHELRAPLTNIAGGLELTLALGADLDARTRERLALVQAEVRRLGRFVETILDLSALEAGRLPLTPAPLALAPLAENLLAQLRAAPGGERVRLDLPPALPLVLADERALASVLFHLADNALKYAPEGAVTIAATAAGGRVRVTVSDQGPGIPPEQRAAVFERFQRLDSRDARAIYGHGLGLYMVRRLLQALGGEIGVADAPAGGACFWFELPAAEDDA